MQRHSVVTAALVLVIAEFASAEVTFELIDRGVPTNGTLSATGYTGYTLRLSSEIGRISAIDLSSNQNGIFGPLVQRWVSSEENGVYDAITPGFTDAQNLTASVLNFDSHFLMVPPSLVLVAPGEDASIEPVGSQVGPFPVNSLYAGFGQGSRLITAFGIIGAPNLPSIDLAYLVIPNTGTIEVAASIAIAGKPTVQISSAQAWTGANTTWNTAASNTNWRHWGKAASFENGVDVQFGDAGVSGGGTVQVDPAGVAPRKLSLNHEAGTYVFSGGTINAGAIQKTGSGEVVFNGPVSTTGSVTFNSGPVRLNSTFHSAKLYVGGGTLSGTGAVSGGVSFGSATLEPGGSNVIGDFAVDSISFGGSKVSVDMGPTSIDRLLVTEPNGLSISSISQMYVTSQGGVSEGTYTVIDYAGDPLPKIGNLALSTRYIGGFNASLVNNIPNRSIDLFLNRSTSWQGDSDGSWSNHARWTYGMPGGAGISATLGPVITGPRTIRLDGAYIVGSIIFDSPVSYTLSGGTLTLQGIGSESTLIDVQSGTHTIATPVRISNTTVNVATGSRLNVAALSGSGSLVKTGGGTLRGPTTQAYTGTTTVSAGTFILATAHNNAGTYTIAGGATLAGAGTISSRVTVLSGAAIAPGFDSNSRGVLNVNELSLDDSMLFVDITSGGVDKIVVKNENKFLLDGVSTVNISGNLIPGAYTLIDYAGNPLSDVGQLVLGTYPHVGLPVLLAYHAENTSIELVIGSTVNPEPGALAIAASLWLVSCGLRRRRRQQNRPD